MSRAFVCGQWCVAPKGDYYVQCSFDKSHIVLRSRMTYHILKCLKQNPNHNKVQCPYDSTEYFDPDKFDEHMLTCQADKGVSIVEGKMELAELRARGIHIQQAPFFHRGLEEPEEDWGGPPSPKEVMEPKVSARQIEKDDQEIESLPIGRGRRKLDSKPKAGVGRAHFLQQYIKMMEEKERLKSGASSIDKRSSFEGQFDDS